MRTGSTSRAALRHLMRRVPLAVAAPPAFLTAQAGRQADADSPNWVADQARYDLDEEDDTVRALSFEEKEPEPTPDKTIIPFKPGERASGLTPSGAEGWQQANLRLSISRDEAGRSATTPVYLDTPKRDKKA